MRKRELLKQFWISYDEDRKLKLKCQKANMNESAVIRSLIDDYEPREKPDDRFYESLKEIRLIGNNLNQIASKAHSLGYIDEPLYRKETEKLNNFMIEFKKKYLLPVPNINSNIDIS